MEKMGENGVRVWQYIITGNFIPTIQQPRDLQQ